jgi:hypothetical protein
MINSSVIATFGEPLETVQRIGILADEQDEGGLRVGLGAALFPFFEGARVFCGTKSPALPPVIS